MGYFNFENNITAINDVNLMAMQKELMKMIFQVNGLPYITPNKNENPADILGFGTWERVKGKVLVGLDEDDTEGYFDEIGKEGGEKKHTQTIDELATHEHPYARNQLWYGEPGTIGSTLGDTSVANAQYLNATTSTTGGGQPMNVTQPYRVVGYMWIRTA